MPAASPAALAALEDLPGDKKHEDDQCQIFHTVPSLSAETRYKVYDLLDLLVPFLLVAARQALADAAFEMPPENIVLDLRQGVYHRAQLKKNIVTVALFFNHPSDAPHLSLDAAHPVELGLVVRSLALQPFPAMRAHVCNIGCPPMVCQGYFVDVTAVTAIGRHGVLDCV